jgi:PAS domain S-box-containing protein
VVAPQSRSVQQLAEVLATLVSSSTEAEATQGAVERVAECFDSEVGAMVRDGAVVASVGFRRDGPVPPALVTLAAGNDGTLDVPGAGPCAAVVVEVPSESPSRLLLARSGEDGYSLEEVSLLRSMGRILANALDMLRLRDMVAASEARFRRIVETANEGIWLLGADGMTTFANDKTAEIFGYSPVEMAMVSLFDVLDEAGKAQAANNLERRRQGISDQLECAFLRKDGSRVWVLLNASPLLDGEGDFVGSLCMISDISHRKEIEEELRETTARFRLLQAMATAANEASCLEEVLQVAVDEICAHTGWVAGHAYLPAGALDDSVVPMPIWRRDGEKLAGLCEALVPAHVGPASGLVGRVLNERSSVWAELEPGHGLSAVERVASGLGLAGAFAFPVCVSGEVTCILEFFSPAPMAPNALLLETIGQVATQLSRVAERQRANNELATARDAAMESSRLKSDFLATMSHEIRTPMNGVIGLTGLLLSTGLDDRQRQYAEGVQSAGEALLAIINDILDFSKIEAGRLELEVIDFDLVQVIEEAAGLVASPAQRKGLELVTSCPASLPGGVRGDPARLRQVLLNLASNAVKFTPEGEIVIRAQVVGDSGDNVTVRFAVTDTGIGISEADGRRLFEPFSQADASTTRRFGGTGLGLAISRRLAAAMGGELGFDSVVGRGSTFWFTLPLQRQAGAATPVPAPAPGGSVLIVDDNETSRTVLAEHLGAGADVAADGVAALGMMRTAAARGEPYGFAVIDAGMPGLDGVELARRIAADPGLAATRLVLMLTAPAPGRFTSLAGVTCLTKPVRVSQLAEALQAARPPAVRASSLPATPPPEIRGHVLVVEDNASNQLVAVGILRLLGYRADVASDGTEALDALDRVPYDAILMDCQMPEMDGFTATREIRRREGPGRHTPVIAMTAGASDSDRDQCLSAGMDDFLSKPVKPRDIDAMLARWVDAREAGTTGEPVLDRAVLDELRQLTPDGSLLADIVDAYLGTVPDHISQLKVAVAAGDAGAVRQSAHRLRGESSAVGAVEVAALCRSLEEQSLAGHLDGAPALAASIASAFERAAGELRVTVGAAAR